jgi:bifunctional non-homologous end joining protein LigD
MSLKEYREKRDFTKSPEPAGDETARAARRGRDKQFFCVQKHLATQLHYDFRLEHNGVLLSWAVPKGPSIDPSDKRLAMHVEDHPIEYGEFEGVIPEGYGAGVVMLWDRGTWEPEVDDVDAALSKGDLKLRLNGFKLKGSWVLVRTRGYSGRGGGAKTEGRSWLLIKHRDEWAGPIDIVTFAPNSVKSGGTFRDILAAEAPDVWLSGRQGRSESSLQTLARILEKVEALEPIEDAPTRRTATPAKKTVATGSTKAAAKPTPKTKVPARTAKTARKRGTARG